MTPSDFDGFCQEHYDEISSLVQMYADYEPLGGVANDRVRIWLQQFQPQHRSLALKLANAIKYYGTHQLNNLMAPLRGLVDKQVSEEGASQNEVFFVPFGRSGESGEDIARKYRNVNRLHRLQDQFVKSIELPGKIYSTKRPVVVFLDDFIGTGDQVVKGWHEMLHQIIPEYLPLYLAVVAAFKDGVSHIEKETPLKVLAVHTIGPRCQLLESAFRTLANDEKRTVKRYCDSAGNQPLGYGGHGLLVSFAYGTPNNTISVIRGSEKQKPWRGLLPDWEDL